MQDIQSLEAEHSTVILNPAQQTSLAITLRELEARLARMHVLLELNETHTRLTPEAIHRLWVSVEHQQALIADLRHRFHLRRQTEDVVQTMIAELSISWTKLVDSRSEKLRRYGSVDPRLGPALDPELDQLTESCLNMIRLLEQARKP